MALFQALCSFLIQKGLYFQTKRPNFIPIGTEQWEILKLVQGFSISSLDLFVSFRFTGAIFLKKTYDEKLKTFVTYFFYQKIE